MEIRLHFRSVATVVFSLLLGAATCAQADLIETKTGDHYNGTLISMNAHNLIMTNEILGRITLPRNKIARITLAPDLALSTSAVATNPIVPVTPTNAAARARSLLQQPATATGASNIMQWVQQELLTGADPTAQTKFQALAGGLLSGQISEAQIRAEAQTATQQLRRLKKDLGDDFGDELDGYLNILDHFLSQPGSTAPISNSVAPPIPSPSANH